METMTHVVLSAKAFVKEAVAAVAHPHGLVEAILQERESLVRAVSAEQASTVAAVMLQRVSKGGEDNAIHMRWRERGRIKL